MFKPLTEEVFAAITDFPAIRSQDIEFLREKATVSARQRARILLHGDPSALRHEMLIAMGGGQYLPPHRNDYGSKTYIVLEGAMVVVRFKEDGSILDYQRLASGDAQVPFMARISSPVWHTCLYETKFVIYIENVQGPHKATVFADWAPAADSPEGAAYLTALHDRLRDQRSRE